MSYILLNKNDFYVQLGENNKIIKTTDLNNATLFVSEEKAKKLKQKASNKLKDFSVVEVDAIAKSEPKTKRRGFSSTERDDTYNRYMGICGLCGKFVPVNAFTVDHIIPISKGGTYAPDNLQLCHFSCNQMKGDDLPEDFFQKLIDILKHQKNKKLRQKLKREFG